MWQNIKFRLFSWDIYLPYVFMALGAMEKIETWVCTMPINNMSCQVSERKDSQRQKWIIKHVIKRHETTLTPKSEPFWRSSATNFNFIFIIMLKFFALAYSNRWATVINIEALFLKKKNLINSRRQFQKYNSQLLW